jgi:hypothetical protein
MMRLLRLGVVSLATSVSERLRSVRLRLERLVSQARKPLHPTDSAAEPKAESPSTKTATRRRRKRD